MTGKFVLGLEGYCSIDWRVLKFHQQRCCANSRNFAQFVPNILKWSVVFDVNDDVMAFVMMIMIVNMARLHDLSRIFSKKWLFLTPKMMMMMRLVMIILEILPEYSWIINCFFFLQVMLSVVVMMMIFLEILHNLSRIFSDNRLFLTPPSPRIDFPSQLSKWNAVKGKG